MPSLRPRVLLPVAHRTQQSGADCLPTCAMMVLAHMGYAVRYGRLMRMLNTSDIGTPFSNLRSLSRLGVVVTVASGTLDLLYEHLCQNQPCIVPVQTVELPHWPHGTEHAVVVVGMDQEYVYMNDPSFDIAPILVPIGDFDLAWLAMDEDYSIFSTG